MLQGYWNIRAANIPGLKAQLGIEQLCCAQGPIESSAKRQSQLCCHGMDRILYFISDNLISFTKHALIGFLSIAASEEVD